MIPGTRRSTRTHHPTYDSAYKQRLIDAVIANLRVLAPVVQGVAQLSDNDAAAIIPANDLNCCAVYRAAIGHPHVAFNSNNWQAAASHFGMNYQQVNDTTLGKHCEMKILDNLAPPGGAYIGISKLCCLPCGAVLALAGIASRGCHGKGYETGWEYPAWLNGPGRLQAFLGATAWPLYTALSAESQRLFLSDLKVSFKTLS